MVNQKIAPPSIDHFLGNARDGKERYILAGDYDCCTLITSHRSFDHHGVSVRLLFLQPRRCNLWPRRCARRLWPHACTRVGGWHPGMESRDSCPAVHLRVLFQHHQVGLWIWTNFWPLIRQKDDKKYLICYILAMSWPPLLTPSPPPLNQQPRTTHQKQLGWLGYGIYKFLISVKWLLLSIKTQRHDKQSSRLKVSLKKIYIIKSTPHDPTET